MLLPSARPTLMVGVNQVIMLALNMVIIASMIGAGGLGYDVLLALRALKVGEAMEAGLAIVALAIALDRLSQAIARRQAEGHVHQRRARELLAALSQPDARRRHPCRAPRSLSLFIPAFADVPKAITFTTAPAWKAAVNWVTINFFDVIEAFRVALILYVLNPVRAFCEGFPWLGAVFLLGLAGYQLGGARLAAAGRGADRLLRRHRAVGKDHGDGLSLRHLGLHRLPDRHSARADGVAQRPLREDRSRRSSTRCRCCRPSASSSRW